MQDSPSYSSVVPMSTQEKLELVKSICVQEFLVPFEGYAKRLPNGDCQAYPDPGTGGAPWTIGYGCTFDVDGSPIKPGTVWTLKKALYVKGIVLNAFLLTLLKTSPKLILEHPRRIAAVLSWVYNIGFGNYRVSTFKKRIESRDWVGAQKEAMRWNKANGKVMKGLTTRRAAEGKALVNP